jgi:undecaprenyl-diphosphatase
VVTHRVDWLDPVFVALSRIGTIGALWIAIAVVVALLQRRPVAFMLVTAAVLAADLLATGLKFVTDRPRPYVVFPEPEPLLATPLDLSLPSGHAATSFAGATMLAFLLGRRVAPVLLVLAALVAASRVYVGVHYPVDVVAGAALGTGVTLVLRWLEANRPRSRRSQPAG